MCSFYISGISRLSVVCITLENFLALSLLPPPFLTSCQREFRFAYEKDANAETEMWTKPEMEEIITRA